MITRVPAAKFLDPGDPKAQAEMLRKACEGLKPPATVAMPLLR